MNELTPFKKGDWIIATKPRMEQRDAGMFMSMGMVSVPDRKFMHRPVQVHAVTEAHIQKTLATYLKKRTAIFIAHRLRTVADLDRILVLENGKIAEEGAFRELAHKKGAFSRYYKAQSV